MKPLAALILVLAAVLVAVLLVWLSLWWVGRQAGVRREEFQRMKQERTLYARAVADIEAKTDTYRDLESMLATDVRQILRTLAADRLDLS